MEGGPDTLAEQGDDKPVLEGHAARTAGERLRELADAEAERAEADEPAAEPADEPADEPPPPAAEPHPLAAYAEPCTDENLAALGEPARGYAPCPFCDGYGAVDPDQLIAALPNVIEALAPYPASTVFVRCDECDGWGSVLTGGRTGENGIQPCPKCLSHGYLDTRERSAGDARLITTPGLIELGAHGAAGDPFTTAPPEGAPPAPGLEWDAVAGRWQYPAKVA